MKLLVLADLHYNGYRLKIEKLAKLEDNFDGVLLCGDNAEFVPSWVYHHKLFGFLRKKFSCPIGFVAGNHDLWGKKYGINGKDILDEIMPRIAKGYELSYLEKENLKIGKFTISGTYGHYDYSFAKFTRGLTMNAIRNYSLVIPGKNIIWKDGDCIDWQGKQDLEICHGLLNNLEQRVNGIDRNLIIISHMVSNIPSIGHPEKSIIQDFCSAYSGSKKFEQLIQKHHPIFHLCGHTHAIADINIGETRVLNVGSDYNLLRYLILEEKSEKWSLERSEHKLYF